MPIVYGLAFRIGFEIYKGPGFRVYKGPGFRVLGSRVQGLRSMVHGCLFMVDVGDGGLEFGV